MAAKKKTKKTTTKRAASKRKPAPAKPVRHRQREQQPAYSAEQRQSFTRPAEDYDRVATQAVDAWKKNRRHVSVPDLTPQRLAGLVRVATKAWDKEQKLRAAFEQRLRPLTDKRMAAEDAAADALGDLHAQVKASARRRPELEQAFATLYEYMARPASGRAKSDEPKG